MKVKKEDKDIIEKEEVAKRKPRERGTFRRLLLGIVHFIEMFLHYLLKFVLGILTFIEKFVRAVGLLIIAIPMAIILLAGSVYLINSAFGIQDSPAFQNAREQLGLIYSIHIHDELLELEEKIGEEDFMRIQAELESEIEIIKGDPGQDFEEENVVTPDGPSEMEDEIEAIKEQLEAIQETLEELES